MKRLNTIAITALCLGMLAGCSTGKPITVINGPIPAGLSHKKIESAILGSPSKNRGWVLKKESANVISGRISKREHSAEISIPFTNTGYSIKYVASQGLNEKNGRIHPNYNRWVMFLNQDIQNRLGR